MLGHLFQRGLAGQAAHGSISFLPALSQRLFSSAVSDDKVVTVEVGGKGPFREQKRSFRCTTQPTGCVLWFSL